MRLHKILLPESVRKAIREYRLARKAERVHARMEQLGQDLAPELIANLKVVPDRTTLLQRLPQHGTVAEVGVAQGDFSGMILEHNQPKKLHLIDPWESMLDAYNQTALNGIEQAFAAEIASDRVVLNQGYSWDELAKFDDATFDWVYIDAAHDYDSVKKDLEIAHQKVKPDGYICGHDYVLWSNRGLSRFGVIEAVHEFCNAHRYELRYLTNERTRHLSYALCRIADNTFDQEV